MRPVAVVVRVVSVLAALAALAVPDPLPAADESAARADRFAEFAISGPDEAAIRAFVSENWAAAALAEKPIDERLPVLKQLFADLAGGSVEAVLLESPTEAEIVARNASHDLWFSIQLELESVAPRRIVRLGLAVDQQTPGSGEPEPSGEGGPLTEAEAVKLLAAEIDRRAAADAFSGVLIAERGGRRLIEKAAGLADRERKLPVRLDTKFQIASIGKAFTSVVVHQLAAEGKLDLAAPLTRALPDYPNRDIASRVTIQQLLDHTSGLGDCLEALYSPRGARLGDPRALSDYLPLFVDEPLLFEPGSRSRYSNTGYVVLGLVIEKLTGRSYFDAVRERVFVPAGMTDTGFAPMSEAVPGRAIGYFRPGPDAPLRSNVVVHRGQGSSAGGGYSTAADLLRFAAAMKSGALLPAGAKPLEQGRGIAGGTPAENAVLLWGGGEQLTLVVLANRGEPAAESLQRYAGQLFARVK